jgi:hypothetical protein
MMCTGQDFEVGPTTCDECGTKIHRVTIKASSPTAARQMLTVQKFKCAVCLEKSPKNPSAL